MIGFGVNEMGDISERMHNLYIVPTFFQNYVTSLLDSSHQFV